MKTYNSSTDLIDLSLRKGHEQFAMTLCMCIA
jgi:hypothetical protein